jgi:Luciferase-like monooxygenase
VRVGVVAPDVNALGWNAWSEFATHADALGVDAILLRAKSADSLVLAAALAGRTSWLHVVAEVEISSALHPLHLAERIAVADQCLGGRLSVVVRRSANDHVPTVLTETLAVLELALASRPFAYEGSHWTIPARLEVNSDAEWSEITVTPSPAQFQLPLWLAGPDTRELAQQEGYVWLRENEQNLATASPESGNLRPAIIDGITTGSNLGAAETAAALADAQRTLGVNLAFVSDVADVAALETLATLVRPRVQLAELPAGLETFWESTVPADALEP